MLPTTSRSRINHRLPGLSSLPSWSLVVSLALMLGLARTPVMAQSFRQTQADGYTRYELLDPATRSFRIIYDISATTPGATLYFNPIRVGSQPTVHAVQDMMTGQQLPWEIVSGAQAQDMGMTNANPDGQYIKVTLARPVPDGGEGRIRIDKTYKDPRSYSADGDRILFDRLLGVKRNAVVLPAGYELTGCNYPSQIVTEPDGRIKVSFLNRGPAAVPYRVEARQRSGRPALRLSDAGTPADRGPTLPGTPTRIGSRVDYTFPERAFQDREIVYFLQQPETHSFKLYHDYTEYREGIDRYLNVVRAGSRASNPSALILDTGETLEVETLRGEAITQRGIDLGGEPTPETEVVVIWFDPVQPGQSTRLRISETYTDPARYLQVGEELIWDRRFGRAHNAVVLPQGWYVTTNAIPAVVRTTEDGTIRLDYINDRPGGIDVFIKARRR